MPLLEPVKLVTSKPGHAGGSDAPDPHHAGVDDPAKAGSSQPSPKGVAAPATTPPGNKPPETHAPGTAAGAEHEPRAQPKKKKQNDKAPTAVVVAALIWILFLTAVFVVYLVSTPVRDALPRTIGSNIPITVPWFGALGGCLISLSGIVDFGVEGWKPKYNLWHPLRPVLGAIMGGVGCVLLLITTEVSTTGPVHTDAVFYDGVAFVLGYAESAFRSLIKNVTDAILKPGNPGDPAADDATAQASKA
jgi:hypothetical protein